MKKWFIRFIVLVFWAATSLWLVRYEAFPELFTHTISGYRSMFSDGLLVMDSWMKITFEKTSIGYSHTSVDLNEHLPTAYCTIDSETELDMKIMGEHQRISASATVTLDIMYRLQKFSFDVSSRESVTRIIGNRIRNGKFRVVVASGGQSSRRTVEIPDDVILFDPMTSTLLKNLSPGQKITLKTLEPLSLSAVPVIVRAVRKEKLTLSGREYETTLLETDYQGATYVSWIDREGNVVREESPYGWTMEVCDAKEAHAAGGGGDIDDMLTAMSVPCEGVIAQPEQCTELRLRLTGVPFTANELESNRQHVEEIAGTETRLLATSSRIPDPAAAQSAVPKEYETFLASSPFIQADDPKIVERSRAIVGNITNRLQAARAIFEWVYRNVEKKVSVGVPSAVEVLRRMEGDCNEHTYLFAGLARAAGLPTKVKVGIVYHDGKFYYHAWPSVYVGDWLEMDPTSGQIAVDATHIALVEGDLGEQIKLLKVFRHLKAQVKSAKY